MPDEDKTFSGWLFSFGFENLMTSRAHSLYGGILGRVEPLNSAILGLHVTSHHFLKSKTKEPLKLLSSSGMRGGKFISVNNFSAQKHACLQTSTF